MHIIHVKIEVAAANQAAFVAVARVAEEAAQSDAGCEYYRFHQALSDPEHFVLIEEWRDAEAFAAHVAQPHVAAYREAADRLTRAADVTLFAAAQAQPL